MTTTVETKEERAAQRRERARKRANLARALTLLAIREAKQVRDARR